MEAGVIIIAIGYLLNIFWLIYGFTKVKPYIAETSLPSTRFSIIVPFRNEAENLPKLLKSIEKLNYPTGLFEVILVDDASDDTFQISDWRLEISVLKNIRKTNSPKKDAIYTALQHAKNEWIVTTDADCIVPLNWLLTLNAFIQQNDSKMIASGVYYQEANSILSYFQQLDLLSLQGTTIGSFGNGRAFMCNGANLAYKKAFFKEINGFDGNENIASGDDVFLLQKAIVQEKEKVHFIKSNDTLVSTKTEETWTGLFYQRVRWAGKTANYSGFYSKQLGFFVFLMNLTCLILLILGISNLINPYLVTLVILLKFSADTILILMTSRFFKIHIRHLLLSSIIYPFFSTAVVIYSLFGSYKWKGRKFKR